MTSLLNERPAAPARAADEWPSEPRGFLSANPGYQSTMLLDQLRATEYAYLDEGGHVYLDYTGAGLAAQSQLLAHTARLQSGCYGNPHSDNPTSSWPSAAARCSGVRPS